MKEQFIGPLTRRIPPRGNPPKADTGSAGRDESRAGGTRYIDEIVMMRAIDKSDRYVHQGERSDREQPAIGKARRRLASGLRTCPDGVSTKRTTGGANWNVIALTDLGGSVVERYIYTPYGQLTVHQETSYGDRDGDQDVDSTDKGTPGSTCTGTVSGACRILDLDFDGDYDSTDATKFDALDQGLARHPGRSSTGVHQPFAHQGLLYEPEIGQYQNRYRQYDPGKRRFVQRDPLGLRRQGGSGYQDGMSLYLYNRNTPIEGTDPTGMLLWWGNWCGPFHPSETPSCATDCLDSACCRHDKCYNAAEADPLRILLHLLGITYDYELRSCDRYFCRRMKCCSGIGLGAAIYRGGAYAVFSCRERYFNIWTGNCSRYRSSSAPGNCQVCCPDPDDDGPVL